MARVRARIIVKGNVQMVGFRRFVRKSAIQLNLTGYAENMPDGSVEIVSEGDKQSIQTLISKIEHEAPSLAEVEDISVKFLEYKGEFTDFEVRGEDVPKKDATLGDVVAVLAKQYEKTEEGVDIMNKMHTRLQSIDEKQDQMLEKEDLLREDMNTNFVALNDKYEVISEDTHSVKGDMHALREDIHRLTEAVVKLLSTVEKSASK